MAFKNLKPLGQFQPKLPAKHPSVNGILVCTNEGTFFLSIIVAIDFFFFINYSDVVTKALLSYFLYRKCFAGVVYWIWLKTNQVEVYPTIKSVIETGKEYGQSIGLSLFFFYLLVYFGYFFGGKGVFCFVSLFVFRVLFWGGQGLPKPPPKKPLPSICVVELKICIISKKILCKI